MLFNVSFSSRQKDFSLKKKERVKIAGQQLWCEKLNHVHGNGFEV